MKKLVLGMALAALVCSCTESSVIRGNGKIARGAFDISLNYTELSVSSGITVELVRSETGEGSITADEEVLRHVSIVEENGRVKVSYEPFVTVRTNVKTVVTMPVSSSMTRLKASSAAGVTGRERLVCSSLRVDCSSAAEVNIDVDAGTLSLDLDSASNFAGNVAVQNLDVDMDSAAKCDIEGSADHCSVETDSAANFRGFGLVCRMVEADASSAGGIEVTATDEITAEASSGGSIRYKGAPVVMKQNTSSGGSVREVR